MHSTVVSTNPEQLQMLQQELLAKMSQIDFLVNTCKQLTSTVAIMRNEIGKVLAPSARCSSLVLV